MRTYITLYSKKMIKEGGISPDGIPLEINTIRTYSPMHGDKKIF